MVILVSDDLCVRLFVSCYLYFSQYYVLGGYVTLHSGYKCVIFLEGVGEYCAGMFVV
jgi:hypothetical protein